MKKAFEKIQNQKDKRFLLAVSAGIDSMVLVDVFSKSDVFFAIAHCNFGLRGRDSDADQELVKQASLSYHVEFYSKNFDTISYSQSKKISIQMAARELRYSWFWELMESQNYDLLVTAHHADDNFETALLNLTKGGTSLSGLKGMKILQDKIFRPFLCVSKAEIERYALENNIPWNEDKSNLETYYQRNFIRIKTLPLLKEINPSLIESSIETFEKLTAAEEILQETLNQSRNAWLDEFEDFFCVKSDVLRQLSHPVFRLHDFLKNYGFNFGTCKEILAPHQSGKVFENENYQVIIDRTRLIVKPYKTENFVYHFFGIKEIDGLSLLGFSFECQQGLPQTLNEPQTWYLDGDKIEFPIVLRLWREGDRITPLGMKGQKKLSDYLIDKKIDLHQKSKTYVFQSGATIAAVLGLGISDAYKILPTSNKILKINRLPV
jgi:tRNA(Ile)-lysidine synthase